MLHESLDKIRRNILLNSILLVSLGVVILICPEKYAVSMILGFGYSMVIISIVMLLEFFTGKNILKEFLKLIIAILLGIAGICVLMYRYDVMHTLAWACSFLMMLDGIRTLCYSITYARRAQRSSWWILGVLAVALIVCAVILFVNPWWNTPEMLMKVIGCVLLFSAVVSIIRLIMTWSRNTEKGDEDAEK